MTARGGLFWLPRGRRRFAVVSLYLGYALGLVLCVPTSRGTIPHALGAGLMALSGLASVLGLFGVLQSRRTLFLPSGGVFDERQRTVRDRAYYAAYLGLGLVAALSAVYLGLVSSGRVPAVRFMQGEVILLVVGVILLVLTLPSAMIAWTEPDPPEDSGGYQMIDRRSL